MSTGDELTPPGSGPLAPGMIRDSNRPMVKALLEEAGAELIDLGIIPDNEAALSTALEAGSSADVIVSTGGVSMGDYDVTKKVLEGSASVGFWQVAIQPAKPFAFGRVGEALFFGLPGNPVSVLVSFEQFLRPALLRMQGATRILREQSEAVAGERFATDPEKTVFVRVRISGEQDGRPVVVSVGRPVVERAFRGGGGGRLCADYRGEPRWWRQGRSWSSRSSRAPRRGSGPMESEPELTHLNEAGEVHMVDVGSKDVTDREAVAEAYVVMSEQLVSRFFAGDLPKGEAAAVARVAGIAAAKKTADLIPLCHQIPLSSVEIGMEPSGHGIRVLATVRTSGRTGVEMEAMTAVSVTALTIYDMVKGVERGVTVESVRLLKKSGGRSGTWERELSR